MQVMTVQVTKIQVTADNEQSKYFKNLQKKVISIKFEKNPRFLL